MVAAIISSYASGLIYPMIRPVQPVAAMWPAQRDEGFSAAAKREPFAAAQAKALSDLVPLARQLQRSGEALGPARDDSVYRQVAVAAPSPAGTDLDSAEASTLAAGTQPYIADGAVGTSSVVAAVSQFILAHNTMVSHLSEQAAYISPSVAQGLRRTVAGNRAGLSGIGVVMNADGTLSLDANILMQALRQDATGVMRVIGWPLGIAERVAGQMARLTARPLGSLGVQGLSTGSRKGAALLSRYGAVTGPADWSGLLLSRAV